MRFPSWGLYPKVIDEKAIELSRPFLPPPTSAFLPRGNGMSYGDVCLNDGGMLGLTKYLDSFLSFDPKSGTFECESGVTLDQILRLVVPYGWFLPVIPGTKYITVGGAIANDVHGKNHHLRGTLGSHVLEMTILRSDGSIKECTLEKDRDLFCATIGGLGLTGLISRAKIQLMPIQSAILESEQIVFHSLSEFLQLSQDADKDWEYSAAWLDSLNSNGERGIFLRAKHSNSSISLKPHDDSKKISVPFYFPNGTLNGFTVRAFNFLYFHKNFKKIRRARVHYNPFINPLDNILHWNRIYGKNGFLQYQFVVPHSSSGEQALKEILSGLRRSNLGSFLSVIKVFGEKLSPGWMSFPMPGITVALDIPNASQANVFAVLNQMDRLVESVKGRVYPAKDARMSPESFRRFFPNLERFKTQLDPKFSSNFKRRMGF